MKTNKEIIKDWNNKFDTVRVESGEVINGEAAFKMYIEEGHTVYYALSRTLKDFVSGKEIYQYCFDNFLPTV